MGNHTVTRSRGRASSSTPRDPNALPKSVEAARDILWRRDGALIRKAGRGRYSLERLGAPAGTVTYHTGAELVAMSKAGYHEPGHDLIAAPHIRDAPAEQRADAIARAKDNLAYWQHERHNPQKAAAIRSELARYRKGDLEMPPRRVAPEGESPDQRVARVEAEVAALKTWRENAGAVLLNEVRGRPGMKEAADAHRAGLDRELEVARAAAHEASPEQVAFRARAAKIAEITARINHYDAAYRAAEKALAKSSRRMDSNKQKFEAAQTPAERRRFDKQWQAARAQYLQHRTDSIQAQDAKWGAETELDAVRRGQ